MEITIVTGLSGAGKSRVVDALEDIGYFCVDNMPPKLMPTFAQLLLNSREKREKVAIVTDIRVGASFGDLFNAIVELKELKCDTKLLFIDASDDVLIRRYKETRRKHPLLDKYNGSINDALAAERSILEPAKSIADYIIDSSHMTPTDCKNRICEMFLDNPSNALKVHCVSFGFKYGIPNDSDLMFDVRCLPNPFYVEELKQHTGLEAPSGTMFSSGTRRGGSKRSSATCSIILSRFTARRARASSLYPSAVPGGRHRSVVFAELLKDHLEKIGCVATVQHRDMKK